MSLPHRTDDETLIAAMLKLSNDIQSDEGIVECMIYEAHVRLRELVDAVNATIARNPTLCNCTLKPLVDVISKVPTKRRE